MLTDDDKKWIKSTVVGELLEALDKLINPRFDRVERHLDSLEVKVDNLDNRLSRVEISNDNMLRKLERIEDRIETHGAKLDNHEERLLSLETAKV